jgi:hypothetical protein
MSGMKNALMEIFYCQVCNAQGWVEGEPCGCNPYDFDQEELANIFAEWNKALNEV